MELPSYFIADLPRDTHLTESLLGEACRALKRNRAAHLATRPTSELVAFLAALGANWLKPDFPFRRMALEQGPGQTGFSAATIARGLDAFFSELTAENINALLVQEVGHVARLDKFVPEPAANTSPRRAALARGPELIVHVAAGNLPAPALAGMVFGLLVRAAQFVKCASGAAFFPRLFAHSIYAADPKLGSCIELAEWPGGNTALEQALFSHADCVTATGSDEAIAAIRQLVPGHARFVGYGHRVSFGYIAAEALNHASASQLAALAAADVAAWDQLGCLSPHVFYVETGGEFGPDAFAEMLAAELDRIEKLEPRGMLPAEAVAQIASRRAFYEVRAANLPDTRLWSSPSSTAWTVVYEADPQFQLSCLHRFVYVKQVRELAEALRGAESVRGKVSTVGIAAPAQRAHQIAAELAAWGVTRICPIGRMQRPPLLWRHDGRPALADLVLWTDWELE
ncbi:MAG: hypothetical protein N2379_00770 [Verrucomicrobiae bacterium]|nr:hypothetical protein [Verrucomicrobiae bacterium]